MLQHEIAVLRRAAPAPRPGWAGRAVMAALIRVLPGTLRAPRLVSPGTVVRWRPRLVTRTGRIRTGQAGRRFAGRLVR